MKTWLEFIIAGLLIGLDQVIKHSIVISNFSYNFFIGEIGIWYNSGGVFSSPLPLEVTIVLSAVAIFLLLYGWYYFSSVKNVHYLSIRWGLLLLLTGGVSNLIDRFNGGAVIDIVSLYRLDLHFNVADLYIIVGGVMVITYLYGKKPSINRNETTLRHKV